MDPNATDELEQLRQQVASLKTQLAQAQRMTALGELISSTTHEFNNVLMTILNYARMGMRHEDKVIRDRAFDKIHMATQRAAKITTSILGMARNRKEELEPTDLKVIIEHSMILLEKELQQYQIAVEYDLQDQVPQVSAIGNQIQQVVMNLLINARQAMQDGGRILIGLKTNAKQNTVELSIRDFGSGIATDKLTKIFDPHFTTKSGPDETGKGGSGLGLSTCRNIMEAHVGKIRVESSVGKGTCFTLIFPLNRPAAEKATTSSGETTAAFAAPATTATQPAAVTNVPTKHTENQIGNQTSAPAPASASTLNSDPTSAAPTPSSAKARTTKRVRI